MVVSIGHWFIFSEDIRSHEFPDEDSVSPDVYLINYPGFEISYTMVKNYGSLGFTWFIIDVFKFVYVPTRFETKMADEREWRVL